MIFKSLLLVLFVVLSLVWVFSWFLLKRWLLIFKTVFIASQLSCLLSHVKKLLKGYCMVNNRGFSTLELLVVLGLISAMVASMVELALQGEQAVEDYNQMILEQYKK